MFLLGSILVTRAQPHTCMSLALPVLLLDPSSNLRSSGISHWNQTLSRVCYFFRVESFFIIYMTEGRRLLKAQTKVLDSRNNWVSRVDSKLLETKQRPFQFDDQSRRNWEARIESLYLILNSSKDRESSVNLFLNDTVQQVYYSP